MTVSTGVVAVTASTETRAMQIFVADADDFVSAGVRAATRSH